MRAHLTAVQRALRRVAAETESVRRRFDDAVRAVDTGLSVLVGEPLALARDVSGLTEMPAYAAAGIQARMAAYQDLAVSIITAPRSRPAEAFVSGVIIPGRRRTVANDFHSAVIVATSACAGAIRSVLEHQFTARPHAIAAASALLDLLDTIGAWMDEGFTALAAAGAPGGIDTGSGYQALQEAVALAAGYLVEISFTLLPERRIVLDRPRTIIDLAAELYGAVDERLDFLIDTNELSGSEILELPRGTSVVYYA